MDGMEKGEKPFAILILLPPKSALHTLKSPGGFLWR